MDSSRLLNLKEVSAILNINTEVLRRWLRNKKLPGIKVGSDWRVNERDLEKFINPDGGEKRADKAKQPKMCFKFPKWLEFSGLPTQLNQKYGPEAWPVFKKIIEIDFEQDKPSDRKISINIPEFSERVGYAESLVNSLLNKFVKNNLLKVEKKNKKEIFVIVTTPIKTPKLILDISYEKGGVKDAPSQALKNTCLRRFLEVDEKEI
ncbi:MAG: helix-turn-helix domain-containing protein [Candidatus Rifleibacteriota bacterium]